MKKLALYISNLLIVLAIFSSCSSEDTIIPGKIPFVDPFLIPSDKTDAESVLRRGFYERTGVHLILRDEVGQSIGADGKPYTEMIDLQWGLTSYNTPETYEILEPEQQAKAVEILEKYIMPHLCGEGSTLFSIYPVADYYDRYGDTEIVFSNVRCTLVNMSEVLDAEGDDEINVAAKSILKQIAASMMGDLPYDDRVIFYDFSEEYHGEYISDFIPEWAENQDIDLLYEYGFINYTKDWYGEPEYDTFPTYSKDYTQFRDFVLDNDEEYVRTKFADYPLIISKYEIMCSLIKKAGYIL